MTNGSAFVKTDEQIVTRFINSDENLQIVTDGPDAKCATCGYPERHRIYEPVAFSDAMVLIEDGCPSCDTSRMRNKGSR